MNKLIKAITDLDLDAVRELFAKDPRWITWAEKDGKNALHYLGAVRTCGDKAKEEKALPVLKFLLKSGMDINSIHTIPDKNCPFPATPLWYAYTRGRNEKMYRYFLKSGADPSHCMFAIAWYDDVKAAALFQKFGADINERAGDTTPFTAAFGWRKFAAAEWFLKNGADVDFADNKGNTALFYGVKRKFDDAQIKMLLEYGADPERKNKDGISPRILVETKGPKKFLSLFADAT